MNKIDLEERRALAIRRCHDRASLDNLKIIDEMAKYEERKGNTFDYAITRKTSRYRWINSVYKNFNSAKSKLYSIDDTLFYGCNNTHKKHLELDKIESSPLANQLGNDQHDHHL